MPILMCKLERKAKYNTPNTHRQYDKVKAVLALQIWINYFQKVIAMTPFSQVQLHMKFQLVNHVQMKCSY